MAARVGLAVLALTLLLSACGGDDDPETEEGAAPTIEALTVLTDGRTADLTARVSLTDGEIVELTVDWGDGNRQELAVGRAGEEIGATHAYTETGRYTVRLEAVSDRGGRAVDAVVTVVEESLAAEAEATEPQEPTEVGPAAAWAPVQPGLTVSTIAGGGPSDGSGGGFVDARGDLARFRQPGSLAVDAAGNLVVADFGNNRIRLIAPDGTVTTLAGTGEARSADGPALAASFNGPSGVAIDTAGNVYVSDARGRQIRKIDPSGAVTTLAGAPPSLVPGAKTPPPALGEEQFPDGPPNVARFGLPAGIAVDSNGNVFVADKDAHRIRMITPNGDVSTFAGSGERGFLDEPAGEARFAFPVGLTIDSSGNLFVTEQGNFAVRRITPTGDVTTVFGERRESGLAGIAVDAAGNLYIADGWAHQIRLVTGTGEQRTLAGVGARDAIDGPADSAAFANPHSVAVANGVVYVTDSTGNRIRSITAPPGGGAP